MTLLKKVLTLVFVLFTFHSFALSQETIVIGQVFDKIYHTPIENANVYFKHTTTGSTTNSEGFFVLRTSDKHGKLVVSALGYRETELKIAQGYCGKIDVALIEKSTVLQELTVLPGANPALEILENVRIRRKHNNIKNNSKIVTRTREKTNLFLSDFSAHTLERALFRNLQNGLITTEDSTLLLPLYHAKCEYTLCGKQKTLQQSDSLDISIISKHDFSILLSGIENNIDFYQNSMVLFGRSFMSPIANNGNLFYRYYLIDSINTKRGKQYQINFKPKNIHNPTFSGTMFIDSTTYALQNISVTIPGKNNLNFVKSLQIKQTFSEQAGTEFTLANEDISLLFDYPLPQKKDGMRLFPTVYITRNTLSETTTELSPISNNEPSISDAAVLNSLNTISNTPLIKTAKYIANTLITGYAPWGYIDIGNISNIIAFNKIEFLRLGLPLRTSERLMKNVNIEGYAAYGLRDKEWKYMGQIQAKLPQKKRHIFGLGYEDNYVRTEVNDFDVLVHENGIGKGNMEFLTSLLWMNSPQLTYARKCEARFGMENEWTKNFETILNAKVGWLNYGNPLDATYARPYRELPNFRYNKLTLTGRFSWNERVVDKYFKRIHIYNDLPVLFANAEVGNYRINPSDNYTYYAKLQLMLRQKMALGMAGTLDYMFQSGCILGNVPYSFLQIMHSNESLASDRYRFNLLNNFEFAADKYIVLHVSWNAGGLFFNQIPILNRFGLREIIGAKVAYGTLRNGHNDVLEFPTGMKSFTVPYAETSVGVGNIFGLACVEFIGRLGYGSATNAQKWGVKFRLDLGM